MNPGRVHAPDSLPEDAPPSLRPYRAGWVFGFFNALAWQVALGTPMVLFAEELGASAATVGLMYSFVFLLTPVQVLSTTLIPRFGYKKIMLGGWALRSVFLVPLIFLAWLKPEDPKDWMVGLFIFSQLGFSFFRAVGSSAFLPWINAMLPTSLRGRYFSTDQTVAGIGGVGTLLFCAFTLNIMPAYEAFLLQYGVAFVGSWLSFIAIARLPEAERPPAMSLREIFRQGPRLVVAPGNFRRFLIVSVWVGAAVSAIPPFCSYFLKVGPELSPSRIVFFTTMQYAGVIAGSALLRSRIDRFGPRPFFILALLVHVAVAASWVAWLRGLIAGTAPLTAMYVALGFAASCWFSANMKYLPQVVPNEARALAFSVHAAATSLISGLAAIVWGVFIKGGGVEPSVSVGAFQLFFVVVIASASGLVVLVRRLPEVEVVEGGWFEGGLGLRPFRAFTYLASALQTGAGRGRTGADQRDPKGSREGES